MAVSNIQNCSATNYGVNFKGKDSQDYVKPYHTSAGLKLAAGCSALSAGTGLGMLGLIKCTEKHVAKKGNVSKEGLKIIADAVKNTKYVLRKSLPLTIAGMLVSGLIVDAAINRKQAKFAEKVNTDGKEAVLDSSNTRTANNGEIYCKTNEGKKFGALAGAVLIPAVEFLNAKKVLGMSAKEMKSLLGFSRAATAKTFIASGVKGAITGLAAGALVDFFANKGAKKQAAEQAKM